MKKRKSVPKPSTILKRTLALFGPKGKRWVKGIEVVYKHQEHEDPKTGLDVVHPDGAFCMIGALKKVNTKRQVEAADYLAQSIIGTNNSYLTAEDEWSNYEDIDDFEDIITTGNDKGSTTWGDISRWLRVAIRKAERQGN